MRPGDLVRPVYTIELCEDIGLENLAAVLDESHLCLVLEEILIEGSREYENVDMLRVLTPSGVVGWQCLVHFGEVSRGGG